MLSPVRGLIIADFSHLHRRRQYLQPALHLPSFEFECGFLKFELTDSAPLKDRHVMNGAKTIKH
jgi:hypothetical protein